MQGFVYSSLIYISDIFQTNFVSFVYFQALEGHVVEKYFQEVVVAVEQSIQGGAGGRAKYLNRLHDIYRDILTASNEGVCSALCRCSTVLH